MSRSARRPESMTALAALLVTWRQGAIGAAGADLAVLQGGWDRIVGRLHSTDSGVATLQGGHLVVVATSETAARELALLGDHVVSASNMLLGRTVVRRVTLRTGALPERMVEPGPPPPPQPRALAPEERNACHRTAAVIADDDLRSVFESWMGRHLASGRGSQDQGRPDGDDPASTEAP